MSIAEPVSRSRRASIRRRGRTPSVFRDIGLGEGCKAVGSVHHHGARLFGKVRTHAASPLRANRERPGPRQALAVVAEVEVLLGQGEA
ncbi:hypothetical protein ABZY14_24145 [Streptomyces sp. NPDC006617]|uniref:hypothetical protein n=1 Tax=Streptomyces sp. NPDC006617 TaxID=3155354 RepID=UPI00339FA81A